MGAAHQRQPHEILGAARARPGRIAHQVSVAWIGHLCASTYVVAARYPAAVAHRKIEVNQAALGGPHLVVGAAFIHGTRSSTTNGDVFPFQFGGKIQRPELALVNPEVSVLRRVRVDGVRVDDPPDVAVVIVGQVKIMPIASRQVQQRNLGVHIASAEVDVLGSPQIGVVGNHAVAVTRIGLLSPTQRHHS